MVINFAAGPAKLPEEVIDLWLLLINKLLLNTYSLSQVLIEVQSDLIDYKGTGMSVMEMSHRGSTYLKIHEEAIKSCRELL